MKCDELKAFNCVDSDVQEFCEPCLVYLKSEADKVIAELEAENEMLRRDFERVEGRNTLNLVYTYGCQSIPEFHKTINDLIKRFNQNEKQLTNAKYKRCLAMATWCEMGISYWDDDEQEGGWEYKKFRHCIRWHKRWLELAEHYKEAK